MSELKDKKRLFELHQIIHKLNEEAIGLLEENDILRQQLENVQNTQELPKKPVKASRLTESAVNLDK